MIAGEASGDLYAAHLARRLLTGKHGIHVFGMGGMRLEEAGAELLVRLTDHQAVGYIEGLRVVPALWKIYRRSCAVLRERRPDALVVIDFPTFNMRLAREAFNLGIPVYYFIPPKVWGWKKHRTQSIAETCRRIYTLFPFEPPYYQEYGGDAVYFGHPLVDVVGTDRRREEILEGLDLDSDLPVVCLLPGSRAQEIRSMLPLYLGVARELTRKGLVRQFILPAASTAGPSLLGPILEEWEDPERELRVVRDDLYACLAASTMALATCGTVTLEAAMMGCPMVVGYVTTRLTAWLFEGRHSFRWFSLPNIITERTICPEILGPDADVPRLLAAAEELLGDPSALEEQKKAFQEMREHLGEPGALDRIADSIARDLLEGEGARSG